jgi:hypothetical protein
MTSRRQPPFPGSCPPSRFHKRHRCRRPTTPPTHPTTENPTKKKHEKMDSTRDDNDDNEHSNESLHMIREPVQPTSSSIERTQPPRQSYP